MRNLTKRKKKGEIIAKKEGFCYEINEFPPKILQKILDSKHGTYCFESISTEDYTEMYVSTPNTDRLKQKTVEKTWEHLGDELANSVLYEVELRTYSFLPLYTDIEADLLSQIKNIPLTSGTLFTQVLIERGHNYRDNWISQYDEYIKGNDYPSSNGLIRAIQTKTISLFGRVGNFKFEREYIKDSEDKILDDCYKFEMRLMLMNAADHTVSQFEKETTSLLKQFDYHNELQLIKVRDKQYLFNSMVSKQFRLNQMLSRKELQCLLSDSAMSRSVPTTITPKVSTPINHTTSNIDTDTILPKSTQRQNIIDEGIVTKLTDSFKRTKITNKAVKVHSVNRGATLQKVVLTIPNDIVYTNIEKNLKNIQAALGNDAISMEIGEMSDTVNFYIPCSQVETVHLSNLLQSDEFKEHVLNSELPLVLGEDSIGNPLFSDLTDLKHMLVAGATGSGKSVYLNAVIITLLVYKSPSDLHMILIDPKQVELNHFKDFPHVTFIDDMDRSAEVFASLVNEMENRYGLMANQGCKNIIQYNNKAKSKLPYIVCVVDELSDLMDTHGDEIENYIIRMGQKARAAGIHMILCTQKPSADVVTTRIKSNLPSAISFRLKAQSDYRTVFGKGIPYHLLGKGDGVCMIEGNAKEFVRFQSPVISLDMDEEQEAYDKARGLYEGVESEFSLTMTEPEEPIDKLKRIIADTGHTKVTELQKHMQMRINVVSELMKELVEEGWLIKEGKGYKLVVSEDELINWRS